MFFERKRLSVLVCCDETLCHAGVGRRERQGGRLGDGAWTGRGGNGDGIATADRRNVSLGTGREGAQYEGGAKE